MDAKPPSTVPDTKGADSPRRIPLQSFTLRCVAVAIVLSSILAAGWIAYSSRGVPPSEALYVDESALDLGEVWEDAALVCELPIHNRGRVHIGISEFLFSCGCVKTEPSALDLPAGGIAPLRVTLNLTNVNSNTASQDVNAQEGGQNEPPVKDFAVQISPKAQGPNGGSLPAVIWTFHGRVKKTLRFDPPSLGHS